MWDEGQSRFQGQKVTKCLFLVRFQRVIPLFCMKFHEDFNGYDDLAVRAHIKILIFHQLQVFKHYSTICLTLRLFTVHFK